MLMSLFIHLIAFLPTLPLRIYKRIATKGNGMPPQKAKKVVLIYGVVLFFASLAPFVISGIMGVEVLIIPVFVCAISLPSGYKILLKGDEE
jgi:hypothetical protein